jgi:hypothetical protein
MRRVLRFRFHLAVLAGCLLVLLLHASGVRSTPVATSAPTAGVPAAPGAPATPRPEAGKQAFDNLPASAIIEHAIGIADIAFGKDPNGAGETLHFTGPVKVQKWPMPGYTRTVLPDGRVRIMAEIVDRDKGMLLARCTTSFQLKSPVSITVAPGYPWEKSSPAQQQGNPKKVDPKHPQANPQPPAAPQPPASGAAATGWRAPQPGDPVEGMAVSQFSHRSIGTITQITPGVDFPAQAEIDLFLNLHTPMGVLHNVEPLALKSVIDSIPPTKVKAIDAPQDEWHAANMPIRFVNDEGETMAWMTTRAHSACLVHPDAINQVRIDADVTVQVAGKDEKVHLQGMSEIHRYHQPDGDQLEMVQLFLDGNSAALDGPIMLTAPNNGCRRVPIGKVSDKGTWFDLPVVLKTMHGILHTGNTVRIASAQAFDFPAFGATLHGGSYHPLVDGAGATVGNLERVDLKVVGPYARPPIPGVLFRVPGAHD